MPGENDSQNPKAVSSMRNAVEDVRVSEARLTDAIHVLRRMVHGSPSSASDTEESKKEHDKRFVVPVHADTCHRIRDQTQLINSLISEIEYGTPDKPESEIEPKTILTN